MQLISFLYILISFLGLTLIVLIYKYNKFKKNLYIEISNLREENENIKRILSNLDDVDEINQIYTYRYFHHLVEREIERAERYDTRFSLLFIETSGFSEFSDMEKKAVFKNILDVIKSNIRLVDICFQNEITYSFILVLAETNSNQAYKIAERIYNSIKNILINNNKMEFAMGIVSYPEDGTLRRNLIEKSKICIDEAFKKNTEPKIVSFSKDK